jgi:hypothetical protein
VTRTNRSSRATRSRIDACRISIRERPIRKSARTVRTRLFRLRLDPLATGLLSWPRSQINIMRFSTPVKGFFRLASLVHFWHLFLG